MRRRRSTSRSATSSSPTPDSSHRRCRGPARTATGHEWAGRLDRKPCRALVCRCQRDLALVGARRDRVKSPPTRPCRPSSETGLGRRPGRDTTQGSQSRGRVYVAARYATGYQTKIISSAVCTPASRRPEAAPGHPAPAARVLGWYRESRRSTTLIGCRLTRLPR